MGYFILAAIVIFCLWSIYSRYFVLPSEMKWKTVKHNDRRGE